MISLNILMVKAEVLDYMYVQKCTNIKIDTNFESHVFKHHQEFHALDLFQISRPVPARKVIHCL